jgi:hypothetical protein
MKKLCGGIDNMSTQNESFWKEKQELEFRTTIKLNDSELTVASNSQALEMVYNKSLEEKKRFLNERKVRLEERKIRLEERKLIAFFVVGLLFCAAIYFGLSGYMLSFHRISVGVIGITDSLSKISETVSKIDNIPFEKICRNIDRGVQFGLSSILMYITYILLKRF